MLKPVLQIQSDFGDYDPTQTRMLMEVNHTSFGYVLLNLQTNSLMTIKYFEFSHLKDRILTEILREIIYGDELFEKTPGETILVYNLTESSLVPEKYFDSEDCGKITDVIFGGLNAGYVIGEKIPWWELYNVYRVPADVHGFLKEKFDGGKFWHKYSLLLKSHKMFNVREYLNFIKIIFYTDKIVVLVFKNHQLQLAQSFAFSEAGDVLYHLLNCCGQFDMNAEEVVLQVSGLIDRQSAIYNELLKYFLHFLFDDVDANSIFIADSVKEQYPIHYYSSFLKMAICV